MTVSRGALETANDILDKIIEEAGARSPCLRDDLYDNREWIAARIAEALDNAADGRPLRVDESGPY